MADPTGLLTGRRAAVVGSGFGGLALAIRLQAAGVQTVLFEARDRPGGRAYVYQQDGFTFDAGPTVITAPGCLEELFALAGERMADAVELLPVLPFYRLRFADGSHLDYDGNPTHMAARIAAFAPRDCAGYERFLAHSREVFEAGYEGLATTAFPRFSDMVRVSPELVRLQAHRDVYATVARFVDDERLRQALSFHALLIGGNPFETSAIYTLIPYLERRWGIHFPRGGTGALVAALAGLFQRLGGELRLSTPVERISPRGPRGGHVVHTHTGAEPFDVVASNADVHHTYRDLLSGVPAAERRAEVLERSAWSMSLFVLYFGTDRKYPDVAHHTVLFGRRYRELLREIFHGPRVPDDFSLYLHAPTVTDPSLAPPGCEAFYVLAPVPHLGSAAVDWTAFQEVYGERILAALESELPELSRHIVTKRAFTPQDFATQLNAYQGSAFSLAPRLGQSAYFRPHNRDGAIPGLYLVGAGTHPGAGVPGVVSSAKATARLIFDDLLGDTPAPAPGRGRPFERRPERE
jgi:phytoene desaturase